MKEKNFVVSCIHGGMEPEVRNETMREFREGASRILISTDLLARGIDVHQVGLVINYELPVKKENYIHRIGRSGRYGRKGVAINLISNHEAHYLLEIQEFYHTHIDQLQVDRSTLNSYDFFSESKEKNRSSTAYALMKLFWVYNYAILAAFWVNTSQGMWIPYFYK